MDQSRLKKVRLDVVGILSTKQISFTLIVDLSDSYIHNGIASEDCEGEGEGGRQGEEGREGEGRDEKEKGQEEEEEEEKEEKRKKRRRKRRRRRRRDILETTTDRGSKGYDD